MRSSGDSTTSALVRRPEDYEHMLDGLRKRLAGLRPMTLGYPARSRRRRVVLLSGSWIA